MIAATPETFEPARFARKLNLGCGFDLREGYLNVDMNVWHKPDLLADVRKLGFLPAQYYEEILAQDVLEHLPRTETLRVLAHWNRPLKMGGKLYFACRACWASRTCSSTPTTRIRPSRRN